ncbi:protein YvfG [Bacillus taeanensis]|uniref:Uncharacterized protein n=1 Tax=Bacillus taeanensis TaxID=273032 RepID=A0A366XZL8_9BACI|nr:protein YvfG [Bacillus taeanensis]RBW71377.1 hypothetical protein DS031_01110 [Bacillus taeanensis]
MHQQFSVAFFEESLRLHIERNKDILSKLEAINGYYRSIVSTLISDNLTKNSEIVKRIRNLEEAYHNIKNSSGN